jgi:hypothetical protein
VSPQQFPAAQHVEPQQVCPAPQAPQSRVPPQPSDRLPHRPPWQVNGVQQKPSSQTWRDPGQLTHALPPLPQACTVAPDWQTPVSSQQPVGQFCGVQSALLRHVPFCRLHVWPAGQLPQVPPAPQPSSPHCRPLQLGTQQFPCGLHWFASSLQHPSSQESAPRQH